MGLDMYLYDVPRGTPLPGKTEESFDAFYDAKTDVAYWRKANAVHRWFVENVQKGKDDCGYYPVTTDQLHDLRDTVEKVLKANDNPKTAEQTLPTTSGFFFGSTGYDQWYYDDLRNTLSQLDTVLDTVDEADRTLVYHSSW